MDPLIIALIAIVVAIVAGLYFASAEEAGPADRGRGAARAAPGAEAEGARCRSKDGRACTPCPEGRAPAAPGEETRARETEARGAVEDRARRKAG